MEKVKTVKAYILGDGSLIKQDDIPKVTHSSEQIKDSDIFGSLYNTGKIYEPVVKLNQLVDLLYSNFIHYRCINQKVSDVVGQGYLITSGNSEVDEAQKENIEKIEALFKSPNSSNETFSEILKKFWNDYEALGQAYLEISMDKEKIPVALWHAPAQTMRICVGDTFYVQIINNKKKYFRKFGITDKQTEKGISDLNIQAGELSEHFVFSMHNYSPKDVNYGVPDYYPVMSSILLDKYRGDFNISFFENNAVPRYAVIVTGADIKGDVENAIKAYFQSHIKGQAHKTLVISVGDKEVTIKFEKLAVEMQESSFRLLHQDALYDICLAHGVPPRWVGIAEKGSLGGSKESESQSRNYKTNYIDPNQRLLAGKLTDVIIRQGFKIEEINIMFSEIDITDVLADAKVGDTYLKNGALSINEFRTMYLSLKKLDTPSADKHIIYSKGQAIMLEDLDSGAQELIERKAVKEEENKLFKYFTNRIANEFGSKLNELKDELEKQEIKHQEESKTIFEKMFHFFKGVGKRENNKQ